MSAMGISCLGSTNARFLPFLEASKQKKTLLLWYWTQFTAPEGKPDEVKLNSFQFYNPFEPGGLLHSYIRPAIAIHFVFVFSKYDSSM